MCQQRHAHSMHIVPDLRLNGLPGDGAIRSVVMAITEQADDA